MINKEYFTPKEVANLLGVDRITIYRWIKKGAINVFQPYKGSSIRIHRLEIPTYLRKEENETKKS